MEDITYDFTDFYDLICFVTRAFKEKGYQIDGYQFNYLGRFVNIFYSVSYKHGGKIRQTIFTIPSKLTSKDVQNLRESVEKIPTARSIRALYSWRKRKETKEKSNANL